MTELRDMDPYELSLQDGGTGLRRLLPAMADKQIELRRNAGTFTKDDGLTFAEWVACIDALLRQPGIEELDRYHYREKYVQASHRFSSLNEGGQARDLPVIDMAHPSPPAHFLAAVTSRRSCESSV